MKEHRENRGNNESFAGKFYCHKLIYYEEFMLIDEAIAREKEIKGWTREKKIQLIKTINPDLHFFVTIGNIRNIKKKINAIC
jgi:putative endonuclease